MEGLIKSSGNCGDKSSDSQEFKSVIPYPLLKDLWLSFKHRLDKDVIKGWMKEVALLRFGSNTIKKITKGTRDSGGGEIISISLNTGASLNAMNVSSGFKLSIDKGLASIFKKHGYNPKIEMTQEERVMFVEDLLGYCRNIYPYSLDFLQDRIKYDILKLSIDKGLASIFKKHGYNPILRKSQEEYVALIEDIVFYCRETSKYKIIDYPDTSLWITIVSNTNGMEPLVTYKYQLLPDADETYYLEFHCKGIASMYLPTIGLLRYRDRSNDAPITNHDTNHDTNNNKNNNKNTNIKTSTNKKYCCS